MQTNRTDYHTDRQTSERHTDIQTDIHRHAETVNVLQWVIGCSCIRVFLGPIDLQCHLDQALEQNLVVLLLMLYIMMLIFSRHFLPSASITSEHCHSAKAVLLLLRGSHVPLRIDLIWDQLFCF